MRIMFWNVKYFGPNSENYQERLTDLAGHISRYRPQVVALVELTKRASIVLHDLKSELLRKKDQVYKVDFANAGGGNNEHFGVLLDSSFGTDPPNFHCIQYRIGGGTRLIGHLSIPGRGDVKAFGLYIAHPSPCEFTEKVALRQANELVEGMNRAIVVGDFNSKAWEAPQEVAVPDTATHLGTSGKLKKIDGAVYHGLNVKVLKQQRVTSAGAESDHSYIIFEVE